MKKSLIIGLFVFTIIVLGLMLNVYAATGTVSVTPSKTELNPEDTFKITLSGNCDEGINGLEALISYEDSIFELVEAKVADDKWINLGQNTTAGIEITMICNSVDTIKNTNMFIVTFKAKENVEEGTTSKINVTGIKLYSDASETYNTSDKAITFTIGKKQEEESEEPVTKKEYTVTFNSNGGSSVASQVVEEGNKASKPASPSKEGYTFVAWYKDAELKTEYDFNNAMTSDITLYAKWNKDEIEEQEEPNNTEDTNKEETKEPEKTNTEDTNKEETKEPQKTQEEGSNTKNDDKKSETKNDDTYNKGKLPQTGENDYIIIMAVLVAISTTVFYILYRKYRAN